MHLKRQGVPKSWSVYRKGTKYLIRPSSDLDVGIPLLVVLRDMLKIVQNRKEAKRVIFLKSIHVNSRVPGDEKVPMVLFDTLSVIPAKKSYRLDISDSGKFELRGISEAEANKKPSKIINKKMLNGKKTQLNLWDGRNFLSKDKCNVNDSVLVNFREKKIEKHLPFKEGANAVVFIGKHSGKRGSIESINSEKKTAELKTDKGEKVNVLIKQLMVTE